jgi:hypothetical protein
MNFRIIPTAEYGEALMLRRFQKEHHCFKLRGSPQQLHRQARREGLNRIYYRVVPVPEPLVMSDPDPRLS